MFHDIDTEFAKMSIRLQTNYMFCLSKDNDPAHISQLRRTCYRSFQEIWELTGTLHKIDLITLKSRGDIQRRLHNLDSTAIGR